jgi:hypothetical protein
VAERSQKCFCQRPESFNSSDKTLLGLFWVGDLFFLVSHARVAEVTRLPPAYSYFVHLQNFVTVMIDDLDGDFTGFWLFKGNTFG